MDEKRRKINKMDNKIRKSIKNVNEKRDEKKIAEKINSESISVKFPLTPMGVLAHRLRTLDRSLVPRQHERKFPAHVSAESPSNISPNPSEVISEVSEP